MQPLLRRVRGAPSRRVGRDLRTRLHRHNVFGKDTTGAENLAALLKSYTGQRRRSYDDRTINTFEGGFVIQYTLRGVQHDGHKGALWICIVGLCKDGRITRIDEYMDTSKFAAWAGRRPGKETAT